MMRESLLLELEETKEALRVERTTRLEREEDLRRERLALVAEREIRAAKEAELATKCLEIERLLAENADLKHRVDLMARRMFGKSSEKLAPGQVLLAFAAAQEEAVAADSLETAAGEETEETPRRPRRERPSKKEAHKDLPVREVRIDPPEAARLCACGKEKQRIGEETSEQIDYVPASCHLVRTIRGKYACKTCQEGVAIAPMPLAAIEKGVAAPGLVAFIVGSKYADHLPLYRQEQILERHGVDLARSTLKDIVAQAARVLEPVADAILGSVLSGRVVNTDDTPVTYLTPPKGSATGYVWAYVGEKREVAYDFTPGRSRDGPAAILKDFKGYVQADALSVYDALYAAGDIVEVACWAHVRRYFHDALGTDAEPAREFLALIQRLYSVEDAAKSLSDLDRMMLRQERARPILSAIKSKMDAVAPMALPKGPLGQAITYARKNWTALLRYLDEGYLAIDNNSAERALRPIAVGRKNWMFAGTVDAGRRAATLMSLVATCKLQSVDPFAYLRDVLVRIPTTPASRVYDLTPRGWKAAIEAGRLTVAS